MEPLLIDNHQQDVEEAGGEHHEGHRPAEQSELGYFSVDLVDCWSKEVKSKYV